jgi:hypothetical protein
MTGKPFSFIAINQLLLEKYKAKIISKLQFRDSLIGPDRDDFGEDISELTEGIIHSDNVVFYLIDDVEVINENCKRLYGYMHPSGKVLAYPTVAFYSYILFVVEISEDGRSVVEYAR